MKNTLKKYLSLSLACALLISMIGCGTASAPAETVPATESVTEQAAETVTETASAETEETAAEEAIEAAETTYPVTLTDQAGREVTLEAEPETIVSGYYIPSSLLIALGLKDKMVGIEAKAGKRAIYKLAAPDLIELPSVGTAKEFDLEGCAALSPDLVILPLKLKDAAASLTELGIPVLLVNPESQELLTEMIELVSTATNTQERANELLSYIASQKSMLSDTLADTEPKSVYLAGNSSLLSTAGPAMYQSSMIELTDNKSYMLANGKNAAEEITDTYWAEISYEQLLAWDPAYIILASDADYTVDDILNDENLKDCTAVKNGQVYQIPGDIEALDSPVSASILASVWLAGILHPEQVPADTYTTESNTYYETFYGISNEN